MSTVLVNSPVHKHQYKILDLLPISVTPLLWIRLLLHRFQRRKHQRGNPQQPKPTIACHFLDYLHRKHPIILGCLMILRQPLRRLPRQASILNHVRAISVFRHRHLQRRRGPNWTRLLSRAHLHFPELLQPAHTDEVIV